MKMGTAIENTENPNISRLFEKIYCNNKKVNATVIEIDDIVDDKLPTFTEEEVNSLFQAKSDDLGLAAYPVQAQRFQDLCRKLCINRKVIFNEMNLSYLFAVQLGEILKGGKHRFSKLDLHKNLL